MEEEEEEEEEEEDEEDEEAVDSADVFTVEAGSTPVEEENKENPDSEVQALVEIRTKLRFIGNQVGLRNPEMVPTLFGDINDQKAKHPDAKFAFCVHVGTSANEKIKTRRAGFMEGRVQSLVDALAEHALEVSNENAFEHYESTRFAGLVMKVYNGETVPECKQEDLVPPPANFKPVAKPTEPPPEDPAEEYGEATMLRIEEGDEVTEEKGDGADVFIVEEGSAPVDKEREENPDSDVKALV